MIENQQFKTITGGAAGIRTLVQTYPPQAFYMFIQLLFVGT